MSASLSRLSPPRALARAMVTSGGAAAASANP